MQRSPPPGFLDDFIHARGHLGDAGGGFGTPMFIPHITDDDRGPGGVPADFPGQGVIAAAVLRCLHPAPQMKSQRLLRGLSEDLRG